MTHGSGEALPSRPAGSRRGRRGAPGTPPQLSRRPAPNLLSFQGAPAPAQAARPPLAGCTATACRRARPSQPDGAPAALRHPRPRRAPQRDPRQPAEPGRRRAAPRGGGGGTGGRAAPPQAWAPGPCGAGSAGGTAAKERCLPRRRGHVSSPDFACHVTAGPGGPGRGGGARRRRPSAGSRGRGGGGLPGRACEGSAARRPQPARGLLSGLAGTGGPPASPQAAPPRRLSGADPAGARPRRGPGLGLLGT